MAGEHLEHAAWLAKTFGRTDYLPITRDDAVALATAGSMVEKYRGTHLFREGEDSVSAFVVYRGEVELYRRINGRKTLIARLGAGSVVGDIAMFQHRPYLSSARANTHLRAFELPRDRVLPVLMTRPKVAMRWLIAGVNQLELAHRSLIMLMNRTVLEQVADLLLSEVDGRGEVRLSQRAIAEIVGASRQSVNEAVGFLKRAGVLETAYGSIVVNDPAAIRHISGCDECKTGAEHRGADQHDHALGESA